MPPIDLNLNINVNENQGTPNKVVADIAARDAIVEGNRAEGLIVYVLDASSDSTVSSGSATYVLKSGLTNSDWEKIGESESQDLTLNKSSVGLPNVDNTSDANKPVSSATQTALNGKADKLVVETKTSAYSLVNGDVNKQIRVTGTTTITLPESLTWGTNEGCEIVNVGANTVTVATGGAVTVNGSTDDITLEPYESVVLMPISSNVYLGTGV